MGHPALSVPADRGICCHRASDLCGLLSFGFLTLLSLPLSLTLVKMLRKEVPDDADARTAQLDGAFGVLFVIAIVLERFV
jgi:hypothetical protein